MRKWIRRIGFGLALMAALGLMLHVGNECCQNDNDTVVHCALCHTAIIGTSIAVDSSALDLAISTLVPIFEAQEPQQQLLNRNNPRGPPFA